MGMLFIFTGLGLILFIGAVAALIWSIRSGQLDDLDTPALRLLTDDAAPKPRPQPTPPTALVPTAQAPAPQTTNAATTETPRTP